MPTAISPLSAPPVASAPAATSEVMLDAVQSKANAEERFRYEVSRRMREETGKGKQAEQVLTEIAAEGHAFAKALRDPEFAAAFVAAFTAAEAKRVGPIGQISAQNATTDIQGILNKRAAAAQELADLIGQSEFRAHVTKRAQSPEVARPRPPLPAGKEAEMVSRLLQEEHPLGPDAPIHDHATIVGHRIFHDALIEVFDPQNGPLHIPLMAALKKQLPEASNDQIHRMTLEWLTAREGPAVAVTKAYAEDGTVTQAAMTRSADLLRKSLTPAGPATSHTQQVVNSKAAAASLSFDGV